MFLNLLKISMRLVWVCIAILCACGTQLPAENDNSVVSDVSPITSYAWGPRSIGDDVNGGYPYTTSLDSIFYFVENICNQIEGRERWTDNGTCEMPDAYVSFREWTCKGDLLKKIADSPKPYAVKREFEPSGLEKKITIENFTSALEDINISPDAVVFAPPNSIEKKEDLLHLALNSYLQAIHYITKFVPELDDTTGSSLRDKVYSSVGDYWYYDLGLSETEGYALLDKMFAALTSLIRAIKETKLELTEERIRQGVKEGDQWTEEGSGRIPGIRNLFGSTTDKNLDGICDGDEATGAFIEQDGRVVIEAEHFDSANQNGSADSWNTIDDAGSSGGKKVQVGPDNGNAWTSNIENTSPYLSYDVVFTTTGTYKIWVRGKSTSWEGYASNSVHGGIDGVSPTGAQYINFPDNGYYSWQSGTIQVDSIGVHTINLFAREDGFYCDKLVIDKNGYTPSGEGPTESPKDEDEVVNNDVKCQSSIDDLGDYPLSTTMQFTINTDSHYCAEFTVHNNGTETTTSWTVLVDTKQSYIYNSWNTQYSQGGDLARMDSLNHNGDLAPGTSETFGFCANKTGSDYTPSATLAMGSSDELPAYDIVGAIVLHSDNDSEYCVSVMVHNYGTEPTSSWDIEIDLNDSEIINLWDANYTVDADNIMTASSVSHNGVILPADVTTFGFCAQKTGSDYVAKIYKDAVSGQCRSHVQVDAGNCLPPIDIIPDAVGTIPIMTSQLTRAIYIITSLIDNLSVYLVEEPDIELLAEELLNNENTKRLKNGMDEFSDLEDFLNEYSIDLKSIENAVKYMTAHMMLFPRLPSFEVDDITGELTPVVKWQNIYMRTPWQYYLRKLHIAESDTLSKVEGMSQDGGLFYLPKQFGLLSVLNYVDMKLRDVIDNFVMMTSWDESSCNQSDESDVLDVERLIQSRLVGALSETERYLGKDGKNRVVEYTIERKESDLVDIDLTVINAGYEPSAADGYTVYDRLRLIPINEADGISKFNVFTCVHIGSGKSMDGCDELKTQIVDIPESEDCELDEEHPTGPQMRCAYFAENVPLADSWMVELRTIFPEEESSGRWRPVGVIDGSSLTVSEPVSDVMLNAGVVADVAEYTLDIDDKNLADGTAFELSGIGNYEKRLDRDWVPSIDNETKGSRSTPFEDSYKHYLSLAKTAADEAKKARDDVIDDIIHQRRDESIAASSRTTYTTDYFSKIGTICGEDINVSQTQFENEISKNSDPEAVKSSLFEVWDKDSLKKYGCKDGTSKEGPIQCAARRNCTTVDQVEGEKRPEVLGELLRNAAYTGMDEENGLNLSVIDEDESECAFYEEELFGNRKIEVPPIDGDFYQNLREELKRTKCSIIADKENRLALIESTPIEAFPIGNREYSSGEYANALSGIDMALTDVRSALTSYGYTFDRAVEAINITISILNMIERKTDIDEHAQEMSKVIRLLNVVLEEEAIDESYDRAWKSCLLKARAKYRPVYTGEVIEPFNGTREDVVNMLKELNGALGKDDKFEFMRTDVFWDFYDGQKFIEACEEASGYVTSPVMGGDPDYITKICASIYAREWERKLPTVFEWQNGIENELFCYSEFATNFMYRDNLEVDTYTYRDFKFTTAKPKESDPLDMKIHFQCKSDYWAPRCAGPILIDKFHWADCLFMEDDESFYDCINYPLKEGETCPDQNRERQDTLQFPSWSVCEDFKGYFQLDRMYLDVIAEYTIGIIKGIDIHRCENAFGCKESDEFCTGPSGKNYEQYRAELEAVGNLLSTLTNQVEKTTISQQVERLKSTLYNVASGLTISRKDVQTKIQNLQKQVNELTRLEQKQLYLFDTFINGLHAADAAGITNLTEWSDRASFKEKWYKEQLRRARIATWTAQRAIEFRFGIDLSDEHSMTIYGDVPAQWANKSLFEDYASTCGAASDGSDPADKNVNGCYSDTERIEDYIQKLEDYVESYGNSPGQDWWLHEDNDTAVISLKEHLNLSRPVATPKIENALFFSEEMDMSHEKMNETYGEVLDILPDSKNPSPWIVQGDTVVESNADAAELLGLPYAVEKSHGKEASSLFEDQQEEFTADIVKDERLLQNIDSEFEVNGISQTIVGQTLDAEVGNDDKTLDFAVYMRMAPDVTCDVAAGETYFSDIGRCGIQCDPETITPEGVAETCRFGQLCIPAGKIESSLSMDRRQAYVCSWCTANGACIGQDGSAVGLRIERGGPDPIVAEKNVLVERAWRQTRVNTISDKSDELPDTAESGTTVSIQSTQTTNLIAASEKYDEEKGWEFSGDSLDILPLMLETPDGSGKTTVFEMSVEKDLSGIVSQEKLSVSTIDASIDQNQYVGSIWIRVESDEEGAIPVTLALETDNGVRFGQMSISKTAGSWTRAEVSGVLRTAANSLKLVVEPSGDQLEDGTTDIVDMAVWGAQIEWGTTATPYIPTGKNLLGDSTLLNSTLWLPDNRVPNAPMSLDREYEMRAPNGRRQEVAALFGSHDTAQGLTDRLYQSVDIYETKDTYSFSVWLRAEKYSEHKALIGVGGTMLSSPVTLDVDVDDGWNRYQIVVGAEDINPESLGQPSQIEVYISPTVDDGSRTLFVWGPQLEEGADSTGYEQKNENLTVGYRAWPLDVGVVGAQLSESATYYCDELGQQVVPDPECVENCTDGLFRCAGTLSEYVRNTYMKEHYPREYHLEKLTDDPYPTMNQLKATATDRIAAKDFRDKVCPGNGTTENTSTQHICTFGVSADMIENSNGFGVRTISPDNFNYRINSVALNIVGTKVIDCDNAGSKEACESNRWINYDLRHAGDEVSIRNHLKMDPLSTYIIPAGYIHGGKAWTSEQTIAYPISSAQNGVIRQIESSSLAGRPLDGLFDLTLFTDRSEINWQNVEDIQLIVDYHYWSKSE